MQNCERESEENKWGRIGAIIGNQHEFEFRADNLLGQDISKLAGQPAAIYQY
jgi:hypothetical protein